MGGQPLEDYLLPPEGAMSVWLLGPQSILPPLPCLLLLLLLLLFLLLLLLSCSSSSSCSSQPNLSLLSPTSPSGDDKWMTTIITLLTSCSLTDSQSLCLIISTLEHEMKISTALSSTRPCQIIPIARWCLHTTLLKKNRKKKTCSRKLFKSPNVRFSWMPDDNFTPGAF